MTIRQANDAVSNLLGPDYFCETVRRGNQYRHEVDDSHGTRWSFPAALSWPLVFKMIKHNGAPLARTGH